MEKIQMLLGPYRKRIDELDREIITLLRKRYDVIEEVAQMKARENIPAVLPDRVDEVRENAGQLADDLEMDGAFIRELYALLIAHSCALEDKIMQKIKGEEGKN